MPQWSAAATTGNPFLSRRLNSFAAIGADHASVLILGTMPGKASLAARQYYAHPRNAFWPLMERLHGVPSAAGYVQRTQALSAAGVALWDVLASCRRNSSLDSDIEPASAVANDLRGFLAAHARIRLIGFNGQPARRLFDRLVLPGLDEAQRLIERVTLPSTSPANARLTFDEKLAAWSILSSLRPEANRHNDR